MHSLGLTLGRHAVWLQSVQVFGRYTCIYRGWTDRVVRIHTDYASRCFQELRAIDWKDHICKGRGERLSVDILLSTKKNLNQRYLFPCARGARFLILPNTRRLPTLSSHRRLPTQRYGTADLPFNLTDAKLTALYNGSENKSTFS